MITVYGIPNCDTCRKARKWLKEQDIDHVFHDFRKDGLRQEQVDGWVDAVGWETLLNRRGTTWRKLPDADKSGVDAPNAAALMTANPTLIKRPVFEGADTIMVGFSAETQAALTTSNGVTT
jgi:arsenate reductase (glutaredoxin)